jgi:type VI secretion system secreted protein VgrG
VVSVSIAALSCIAALAATDPGLASAGNFAVLSGAGMTNTGPSWISGAIGASGAGISGFPPGTAGPQHAGDGTYTTAETDLTAAYGAAVQTCNTDYSGVNLGGLTLGPGVYCQTSGAVPSPTLTGTLTLQGSGIYIFLIGTTAAPTTLVTAPSARVVLLGGAQPCQVFWRVTSSATLATSTEFVGNIMANISIQMQTGATLHGRALARTAAVTLDTNRIIQPTGCGYVAPGAVPPPAGNILPPTLPPTVPTTATPTPTPTVPGVPRAGAGPSQGNGYPWILAIAAGVLAAAGGVAHSMSRKKDRHHRIRSEIDGR